MKKTIIFSLMSAFTVLTGCSDDFLEVEPYTQFDGETYYSDSTHIFQSLVAAYSPLQWNDWNGSEYNPQNIMSDIMADDVWPGGASAMDNQYWHLMMNYEAQPLKCMSGLWSNMYTGVKRCNDMLGYAEYAHSEEGRARGFELSDHDYKLWTVEARVLRAYYYNLLWKFYGNIPYYTKNVTTPPYHAKQLSADKVYANVIEDLEDAISDNDVLPMQWTGSDQGRVSQAMAYMLYTEMVMYQNDEARFSKALGFMREIINDPTYNLHKDYGDLWNVGAEWCEESIFEINYTDDKSFRGWNVGDAIIAGGTVLPKLISNPNGVGALGIDDGWGFCPVRESTYNLYLDRDTRRSSSALDLSSHSYKPRYQDTGYWLGKYIAYSANNQRASGDKVLNYNNNLRVYRYAEVLLNAAELIVRTTHTTANDEASDYLNAVRRRAGLKEPADEMPPTVDNIIEERHLEFVGEGKRYWDLIRAEGIPDATVKASNTLGPDIYGYRTNKWSPDRKYLPIPYRELAADNELKQNPNY